VENLRAFGLKVAVAINAFDSDTAAEHALLEQVCAERFGARAILCRHWAEGGKGAEELAHHVAALVEGGEPSAFRTLYDDGLPLLEKIETVARRIYRAAGVSLTPKAKRELERFQASGFGHLPVCMAKTPYSFSADESLLGAPEGFTLPVREVRLSAGAGFVVAICGEVMTMPGLPRVPAANGMRLNADGEIEGLS
jgi:formate--tetrahydrofolate ligase